MYSVIPSLKFLSRELRIPNPTITLGFHRLGGGITTVIGGTAGSTSTVTSTRRSVGIYIYPVLAILSC